MSDSIECPYCKHDNSIFDNELWCVYDAGENSVECAKCERDFIVIGYATWTFKTFKED